MGNKLCAPWRKGYRDEDHPWAPKKDSHLLRLWAEIFEVREEEGEICWARVSDDVVPVNITCIQDTPDTVFQITAYNRHVEKIFDVRLIQPGTRVTQASECFVHWKDSRCDHEWGLNFTTPVDARRFRDCCMRGLNMPLVCRKGSLASVRDSIRKSPSGHNYARKAASSGSLSLNPPKRVRGRKATSNPTSPVSKPRRAVSNPEELALQDAIEAGFVSPSDGGLTPDGAYSAVEGIATVPRRGQRPHAQNVFGGEGVYDNVGRHRQCNKHIYENPYETVGHRRPHHPHAVEDPDMHKPIAERDIPYGQYHQNHSSIYQSTYHTYNPKTETRDAINDYAEPRKLMQTRSHEDQLQDSDRSDEHKLSKPELRQFSREPTVIRISDLKADYEGEIINDYDNLPISDIDDTDVDQIEIKVREWEKETEEEIAMLSPPRKSHSSSSPEWPPPPENMVESGTPETPKFAHTSFDSDTLKRMLRSLPEATPLESVREVESTADNNNTVPVASQKQSGSHSHSNQQQEHQKAKQQQKLQQQPAIDKTSPIKNMQPVDQSRTMPRSHSGEKPPGEQNRELAHTVVDGRPPMGPIKPQRIPLEPASDLPFRAPKSRDSYPDSGVSGMTSESTASVRSGDSGRSGKSNKSATLPPGLGLSSFAKSSGSLASGSGGSSASGRHSDYLRHLGTGSDNEQIRRLATSDLSESESETSGSEEVGGGESDGSSIHTMPSESQASFASKSAAIRKAGWLTVKNWMIHKKRRLELASRRNWKKYWVCLKGTVLLFYACDDNEAVNEDSVPGHMLVIEGGIAQAVPEHPKRENIFSLSTAFGDAYLFQAQSQVELENWVSGLHSACASSFARQHGKENTLKLLRTEIQKLENSIDLDIKMKKMAGLQMSVVTDPKSKQAIEKQISQWDENLEKLYIEQYRLRCYMASLQGCELPNPKNLLGCASKSTKVALSRVGVFTVTSFHALVCARTPLTTTAIYNRKQKRSLLSTFKADSASKIRPKSPRPLSGDSSSQVYKNTDVGDQVFVDLTNPDDQDNHMVPLETFNMGDALLRISLPSSQSLVIGVSEKMSVQEVLEAACNRRQLNPNDHFLRLKVPMTDNSTKFKIPDKSSLIQSEEYDSVQVCAKILFQLELSRSDKDKDFGFRIEAELAEDTETEDELCVFISELVKGGIAHRKGLIIGDEILVINGKVVAELDMVYVENMLLEETNICLTIRSCRIESPVNTTALMEHADMYIDNMTCPPPPSQSAISDKVIDDLIVPAPTWVQPEKEANDNLPQNKDVADMSSEQIDNLLQGAEQVTHFCRLLQQPMPDNMSAEEPAVRVKPLSDSQRIRKVIMELIETERQYVRDLNCLIERYLEPLKEETFLSCEDIEHLFGNIQEIVAFQHLFLQSLEEAVELENNFNVMSQPQQFRRVLFSLSGSFLYYANHFKLYSSFCASHSKAQKLLNPAENKDYTKDIFNENNVALQEFLRARNPKQQHSSTLESYLIKPIQRILKYPLLLKQLKELTDPQSDEHHHLSEALRGMEAVAEHINEMQKIYEEYGAIFDELIRQSKDGHYKTLDLNVGELQMYGTVTWLNALDELGKMKKGTDLLTLVFIFKTGIVLLAQERTKGKKKPRPPQARPVVESGDITRFTTAIPVDQLQVRSPGGDTERHGIWELVHCRSEKEGRPEKIYQFASSREARRDFVKIIHNAIRESVRRMSIPGVTKCQNKTKHSSPPSPQKVPQGPPHNHQQHPHNNGDSPVDYCPNGKRPDSLTMRSLGKKKGKQLKSDLIRHSMDMEDRGGPTADPEGLDFRTRSQTLTDLNNMDAQYPAQQGYPSGSSSTIASERGSAKLIHASKNPVHYTGNAPRPAPKEGLGSPIWKPRNNSRKTGMCSPSGEKDPALLTGGAYTDYSNVVYDNTSSKHSSVVISQPPPTTAHEDTEC